MFKSGKDEMKNHRPLHGTARALHGFFRDDGTQINPELLSKPSLCVLYWKDDNPSEEISCTLNRADQKGSSEFVCDAFEAQRPEFIRIKDILINPDL